MHADTQEQKCVSQVRVCAVMVVCTLTQCSLLHEIKLEQVVVQEEARKAQEVDRAGTSATQVGAF